MDSDAIAGRVDRAPLRPANALGATLRARASTLWVWGVRAWEFVPLSPLGAIVASMGLAGFFALGLGQADFVVLTAAALAIALVCLASTAVSIAAVYLHARLRGTDSGLEGPLLTGAAVDTGFRTPRLRFWPLVQVSMVWTEPSSVQVALHRAGADYRETVTATERGRTPRLARRFALRDVFGLAEVNLRFTWTQEIRIVPSLCAQSNELTLRQVSAEGTSHPAGKPTGARVEMRRYQHGDPLRYVLWKTFARSRRLMVRTPERAIAPVPSTRAYFVAGPYDEPSASTARTFVEAGMLGEDFVFQADGATRSVSDPEQAVEQIIDSVRYRQRGGGDLLSFVGKGDRGGLDNCIFFAPSVAGPWMDCVQLAARRLPAPPIVLITVDHTEVAAIRGSWGRLLWRQASEYARLTELPGVRDALRKAGCEVHVLHRPTARWVEDAQIEAMRVS